MLACNDLRANGIYGAIKPFSEQGGVFRNISWVKPFSGTLRGDKQGGGQGRCFKGRNVQHNPALNARAAKGNPACVVVFPGPGFLH